MRAEETLPLVALGALALLAALAAFGSRPGPGQGPQGSEAEGWRGAARRLAELLAREGIRDPAVLQAMRDVERQRFVPEELRDQAFENWPLPIGRGQTISQPYIVAFMTEAAELDREANVLEVGTGSGYQAAVLAEVLGLGPGADPAARHGRLCSIEIIPELAEQAAQRLESLGYREVAVRAGDGYRGWPERAPFDAILVTAAPDHLPEPLRQQLAPGGRLVIPVGGDAQDLLVVTRTAEGFREERVLPVRFVPMTGEAERR